MLAPDTRELLLDLLRPPDGWRVDLAVGTTFTLDLQALLIAPLSFALFDWALDEDGRIDPLAALEALRRYADRTTVFCQAGMIGLPSTYQPLLIHLEGSVVPVAPPTDGGIFHPKMWVLRFTGDQPEPRYRVLILSRNLTFDTSWDTVVALAGQGHQVTPRVDADGLQAEFGRVAEDGLTAFFAFEVAGEVDGARDVARFVVTAQLEGAPADRVERVLTRLLRDRDDLLRYLQFLLADDSHGLLELLAGMGDAAAQRGNDQRLVFREPALMERLLSILATEPERLAHVDRLLRDLDAAGRVDELAPPGLRELWAVIDEVRRELVEADEDPQARTTRPTAATPHEVAP